MTALETRRVGGLTSDPENNVLIDDLMQRGLVRSIEIWTDEEAEQCRLVAFDVAQLMGHCDHLGRWVSGLSDGHHVRNWGRSIEGWLLVTERFFEAFDTPDFALGVALDDRLDFELAGGCWAGPEIPREDGYPISWIEVIARRRAEAAR